MITPARTAVVLAVALACAPGCGQAAAGSSQPASSHSTVTTTTATSTTATGADDSTSTTTTESTGNAVEDTRAWLRSRPPRVAAGVSPLARLAPHSHGQVLLVGLTLQAPIARQRQWTCRHLYPHFRQVLPIGKTQAVLFVALIGKPVFVGSTYANDTRACAETGVNTSS